MKLLHIYSAYQLDALQLDGEEPGCLESSVPSDASSDASFREESISTGVWEKNQSPPNSLPKLAPAGTALRSLAPELALGSRE